MRKYCDRCDDYYHAETDIFSISESGYCTSCFKEIYKDELAEVDPASLPKNKCAGCGRPIGSSVKYCMPCALE